MRDPVKTIIAVVASGYFLWAAFHPEDWRFVDNFHLVMHEAGHILFMPLGQFMTIAGGSLFQILVPLIFALYFFRQGKQFSGALLLFLMGESMVNVSVYASDAVAMQLPLLGGDDSIHDWNWMLDELGLLGRTREIAGGIRAAGVLAILFAAACSFLYARRDNESAAL